MLISDVCVFSDVGDCVCVGVLNLLKGLVVRKIEVVACDVARNKQPGKSFTSRYRWRQALIVTVVYSN